VFEIGSEAVTATGYPENKAVDTRTKDGLTFSVVQHSSMGHYCGYVRFPLRPVIEQGGDGIVRFVPVHGGVTYTRQDENGMVYGFDCGHVDDDKKPELKDIEWLFAECERMATALQSAAHVEQEYLLGKDNEAKAAVLDKWHAELAEQGIEFAVQDNFGAMIALLCGKL
jgi:hypothetical protein